MLTIAASVDLTLPLVASLCDCSRKAKTIRKPKSRLVVNSDIYIC